jgi:cytochrome c oxidase subunit II
MSGWIKGLALLALLVLSTSVAANPEPWQLNMTPGVTASSKEVYELHMIIFLICCAIGVIVFGAIFYSVFAFRKSKGAVAAKWSHNTIAEVIWTVVPIVILVGMAIPATATLMRMADTGDAEMTVKITGYQWKWRYEYVGTDVNFVSSLSRDADAARRVGSGIDVTTIPNYLLDVDKPLVLPVGTKIRFVITADDVIHSWWVPVLGWKQDAIPGFINEAWTSIEEPGTYRGQCAELCGKDHGFMPIVVEARPKAEFEAWLAAQRAALPDIEATVQATPATTVDKS